MAGIGWKLQRMMDRGSLTGTVGAYLTGVAVTSAPWLLTTAVLMSLRLVARSDGSVAFLQIERIVTLVYALTVILSAPVHVVVSRYTADRLYDRRLERIAAPLWRALALTLAGFALVGTVLMALLRVPLGLGVAGALLMVVVGAQWLMLSVGGGLSSPVVVLRAFGAGAPLSIAAALVLDRVLGFGALGYLYGFVAGQLVTLVLLLHGTARALPDEADEAARLGPAFSEYRLLAVSAFAYYVSIWTDKLLVWILVGRDAASLYAAVAAIAWFSVIPAFGWIYVQIETVFYRRFRAFYRDLERGGALPLLARESAEVAAESGRILRGAAVVQGAVTALVVLAAPAVLEASGLPQSALVSFRLAAVGSALQVVSLLEILLLYYFDLRREALVVSLALLGGEALLVSVAHFAGWPPAAGYAAACAIAAVLGLGLVRRRLANLLVDTFQAQPFSSTV
jgi:polysaccharide biosynthesis protein PelG